MPSAVEGTALGLARPKVRSAAPGGKLFPPAKEKKKCVVTSSRSSGTLATVQMLMTGKGWWGGNKVISKRAPWVCERRLKIATLTRFVDKMQHDCWRPEFCSAPFGLNIEGTNDLFF